MKFITNVGAPDIPLEILEAQESDQLVFFCGAGISYPAGLPSFSRLVDDVYDAMAVSKSKLEQEAIKENLFDRALGLLEQRMQESDGTGINKVRAAIIDRLKIQPEADVSTHKAILDLSCTKKQKYRLVTTNVDLGFSLTDISDSLVIDSAPKIPVPKPHKWSSVVHLHGVIDIENDTNGEHLVFTSGDFGSAYLTERWASKFVTELFSHFTVLFVGYSINDPVLRYMTDAIAAEIRVGYNKFSKPFILASTPPAEQNSELSAWKSRGVEPIFYSHGHNNLHKTLKAWAAYSRDGLSGKANIIRSNAIIPPLPPYDQDESVKRVLDTLKEKTKSNDGNITGYPAKVFRDMTAPSAPIEWLPVLYDEGLLSIVDHQDKLYPISPYYVDRNLLIPNPICENLWQWLTKHLESRKLVEWVFDNGMCLHPRLKEKIVYELEYGDDCKEPYLTFWRIVTSNSINCTDSSDSYGYMLVRRLKKISDSLALKELRDALEPKIKLEKPFYWPKTEESEEVEIEKKLFDAEVNIQLTEHSYSELKKLDIYPNKLLDILVFTTNALHQAMKLWQFLGRVDEYDDRSHWDIVSIPEHKQNGRNRPWVVLVKLCRDLWEEMFKASPKDAQAVIDLWKGFKFPVFRRLVFHAYTVTDAVTPDVSLSYVLENDGRWLWASVTRREKFRLLSKIWPMLSTDSVETVIKVILKGPLREMFPDDLSDEEWSDRFDRDIWHILIKLKSFGRDIPVNAQRILDTINQKHKIWAFSEGERDEFTFWTESRSGNDTDITSEELFNLKTLKLIEKLLEKNREYHDGRIDVFRIGVRENQEQVINILKYINEHKIIANKIWHSALIGFSDSDDKHWKDISQLLLNCDDSLYGEEAWAISHWIRKAANNLKPSSKEEGPFWEISKRLLDMQATDEIDDDSDIISKAINNPIGIIAEAFMDRFTQCQLKAGQGIPKPKYVELMEKIMNEKGSKFVLARVVLASRLQYFYVIDPIWTEQHLLPKFDWGKNTEANFFWQGYLWLPRITADLARELSEHLLETVNRANEIGEYRDRLYQLFIVVCIKYPNLYKITTQRDTMITLGVEGLEEVAQFLWRSLSGEQENKDNYWKNRIQPLIMRSWPKIGGLTSPKTSGHLVKLCLQLNESFPEAVDTLKPFLVPCKNLSSIIEELKSSPLIHSQPLKSFELLAAIFSTEFQWPHKNFREILITICNEAPEVLRDPKYKEIDEYLTIKGL